MLKLLITLTAACGVLSAVSDSEWAVFKAKHDKAYGDKEDFLRRMIYEDNIQKIKEHNEKYARGESTFYLGENQFADMTNAEFVKSMNGMRINRPYVLDESPVNTSLPGTVDWRKKGYVTPVKNQQLCGSCWAFSTTGSVEGQHFKNTGKLVSLSESNLVDCSGEFGNLGCAGGFMDAAFKYIIANNGIDTESSYPYVPKDEKCKFKRSNVGATLSSYKDVQSGSERALQEAVATVGPVSVAIDAALPSFHLYKGGVYDEPKCSSTKLDHGVLAVGYGVDGGNDYWLVKNSWGESWGVQGYIKMSRNKNNQCGIATEASYPVV